MIVTLEVSGSILRPEIDYMDDGDFVVFLKISTQMLG